VTVHGDAGLAGLRHAGAAIVCAAAGGVHLVVTAAVAPQAAVVAPVRPGRPIAGPRLAREHQAHSRGYGGVYNDPRLQANIEQTVDAVSRLSERPDQHYKVTMLIFAVGQCLALPTGQIYVTRGLVALANDESELASVLGPRDGPRHRAARRGSARKKPRKPISPAAPSPTSSPIRKSARWRWRNQCSSGELSAFVAGIRGTMRSA